jgi:hypothetical protein
MGPEELGSVYESLLELTPRVTKEGREFTFAEGAEGKGHARKTTGSYYTPDSLVQVLLDSALNPVMDRAEASRPDAKAEALLNLSIVDPACGSGHFLLAAARRLAARVAQHEAKGTASPKEYRHALRRVVGRCIFGVDLNPLAVELCKVGLWMEAVEPGLPLGFLDSHVQCGNALLGTMPGLMDNGIPDEAWAPIGDDDKKTASALKKRNAKERSQDSLQLSTVSPDASALTNAVKLLDAAADDDPSQLARKEGDWANLLASEAFQHQKLVADSWCSSFVWPKKALPDTVSEAAPTNEVWRRLRSSENASVVRRRLAALRVGLHSAKHHLSLGSAEAEDLTVSVVGALAREYEFFHWHLQFPQVFARGGFDVVIGNPPWDSLLFREEEYFAATHPEIAGAKTAAQRKKKIVELERDEPLTFSRYVAASRHVDGANSFSRASRRFPLCGLGRVNLFGLFAELGKSLVAPYGQLGQVLPSGIVSDDSTKLFFQAVVESRRLNGFYDFENREGIFPGVHRSTKFGLLVLGGPKCTTTAAQFVFFALKTSDLKDEHRRFSLSAEDIGLLNPQTRTCPIFRSRRDADLTKAIYRRVPIFNGGEWHARLRRLLNSADDSGGFVDQPTKGLLPLYEAKYFHQFNHRWATHDGDDDRDLTLDELRDPTRAVRPRYWYSQKEAVERFGAEWGRPWVIAWRDITNSTNERSFITTVIPSLAVSDTAKVIFIPSDLVGAAPSLLSNLSAFAFDFVARQKIGGTHMSAFIVEQLPVLPPAVSLAQCTWATKESVGSWLKPRVVELTYTAWDLEGFGTDVGSDGPPFRWDVDRRPLLRAELDAAFFHLYGLSREDTDYVLETFPIVKKSDEKKYGEYRTKRLILERYDALAASTRTGKYETPLDPPPAHQSLRHPPRPR